MKIIQYSIHNLNIHFSILNFLTINHLYFSTFNYVFNFQDFDAKQADIWKAKWQKICSFNEKIYSKILGFHLQFL